MYTGCGPVSKAPYVRNGPFRREADTAVSDAARGMLGSVYGLGYETAYIVYRCVTEWIAT
jgi:hypothetical protein